MKIGMSLLTPIVAVSMAMTAPAGAQTVNGRLVDESNDPVASAVVTLTRADSTIIAYAVSDNEGGFAVNTEHEGEAVLAVSHLTYLPHSEMLILPHPDSLRIILKVNAEEIGKVVVVGERPLMEMTDEGNLRFNVSQVRGINNNIADVINKLPGATASDARGFTLNGQTATLYIDGRAANIPKGGIIDFLQTIPAESIDNVELNHYTGAAYDASMGSVINIATVRRKNDGWYLSTSASGTIFRDAAADGDVNASVSAHKGKTDIYGMVRYMNEYRAENDRDSTLYDGSNYISEYTNTKSRANTVWAMADVSWEFKKDHTFDFNVFTYFDAARPDNTNSSLDSYAMAESNLGESGLKRQDVVSGNVEYSGKFADNLKLNASYGYVYALDGADLNYALKEEGFSEPSMDYSSNSVGILQIVKSDLTKQFGRTRLGVGLKMDLGHLNSKSGYSGTMPLWLSPETRFTGHENIYAVYANMTHRFNDKFSFNAGLRGELTDFKVKNAVEDMDFNKTYFDLFPTFSITHRANNVWQTLYLRTAILRPDYLDYIPGKRYDSEYSYSEGNPDLLPRTTARIRYVGVFWEYFQVVFSYQHSWNCQTTVFSIQNMTVTEQKTMNSMDADVLYSSMVIPFRAFDFKLYGTIEPDITYYKATNLRNGFEPYRNYQLFSNIDVDIYYDATDRLSFNFSTIFRLGQKMMQFDTRFRWMMFFSASYYLTKQKNLLLSLQLNNLANTGDGHVVYHYSGATKYGRENYMNQFAKLKLTWNFGGGKKVKEGASIANDLDRFGM